MIPNLEPNWLRRYDNFIKPVLTWYIISYITNSIVIFFRFQQLLVWLIPNLMKKELTLVKLPKL